MDDVLKLAIDLCGIIYFWSLRYMFVKITEKILTILIGIELHYIYLYFSNVQIMFFKTADLSESLWGSSRRRPKGKKHKFWYLIGYTLLKRLEMQTWDKTLFFSFEYFFMLISLQASELFSHGSIGLIPMKLFTPHNIDHECIIRINIPSEAILKKIFWLHFEKLITDKWTRLF
jgi:hypothetical protein